MKKEKILKKRKNQPGAIIFNQTIKQNPGGQGWNIPNTMHVDVSLSRRKVARCLKKLGTIYNDSLFRHPFFFDRHELGPPCQTF